MKDALFITPTHSQAVDAAILRAITAVHDHFPKSLLSVYLTGSYANGYAVPTSDVDLFFVFDHDLSQEEEKLGEAIATSLESVQPPVDLVFRGLPSLMETGVVGMRDHFFHIFGEPVHRKIPVPPIEDYAYRGMHAGYLRMQLTRKTKPYIWPMSYPHEQGPLKGYDWREKIQLEGKVFDSIKEIVVLTGWMATGLVAWKGRVHVPTKNQAVALFNSKIGGAPAVDFELITEVCRRKFSYRVPEGSEDLDQLKTLLPKVLGLENFFLQHYQDFLIENLRHPNPVRVRTSILRLGEVFYPNAKSLEALQMLLESGTAAPEELEKSISLLQNRK